MKTTLIDKQIKILTKIDYFKGKNKYVNIREHNKNAKITKDEMKDLNETLMIFLLISLIAFVWLFSWNFIDINNLFFSITMPSDVVVLYILNYLFKYLFLGFLIGIVCDAICYFYKNGKEPGSQSAGRSDVFVFILISFSGLLIFAAPLLFFYSIHVICNLVSYKKNPLKFARRKLKKKKNFSNEIKTLQEEYDKNNEIIINNNELLTELVSIKTNTFSKKLVSDIESKIKKIKDKESLIEFKINDNNRNKNIIINE